MLKTRIPGVVGFAVLAVNLMGCPPKKPIIDPNTVSRVEAAANKAEAAASKAEAAARSAADAAAKAEAAAAKAQSMFDQGIRK